MADPWKWWTAEQIARATGAPQDAAEANWPLIADALEQRGIYDRDVCLGVLGTIAIETASSFEPVREAYYLGEPAAEHHRMTLPYYPYYGRGYIQLTHASNYRAGGSAIGVDLASDPDLALDPQPAADILAWFWATRGVPARDGTHVYSLPELCRSHDWEWVRRVVQGGTDGLSRLVTIATTLDVLKEIPVPSTRVLFEPDYPAVIQNDEWSCAPTSLTWAMRALGRTPATDWIETDMLAHGYVTKELGLMNHTGAGIVEWLALPDIQHYGSDGYGVSNNTNPISWDALVPEIDPNPPYPLLLGLPNWGGPGLGHWSGVRGFKDGRIQLANPATGATFGQTSLSKAEFESRARGNASIVRVLHPDLLTPAPVPSTPHPPTDNLLRTPAEIRTALQDIVDRIVV